MAAAAPASEAGDLAARIVAEARAWIGTPYRHQASLKGIGTDCLGLVRGVWRALHGAEPEAVPAYSRDWGEIDGSEKLVDGAGRHMTALDLAEIRPGDMVVFRMIASGPAKHCGLLAERAGTITLIHAWSGHSVAEVPFDRAWRRRLAFAFRFPEA